MWVFATVEPPATPKHCGTGEGGRRGSGWQMAHVCTVHFTWRWHWQFQQSSAVYCAEQFDCPWPKDRQCRRTTVYDKMTGKNFKERRFMIASDTLALMAQPTRTSNQPVQVEVQIKVAGYPKCLLKHYDTKDQVYSVILVYSIKTYIWKYYNFYVLWCMR